MTPRIVLGDCREQMALLPAESVDAVVTDPPYGLEFMGREWDKLDKAHMRERRADEMDDPVKAKYLRHSVEYVGGPAAGRWHEAWARAALRVAKPGAHIVAFGGTRTFHRLTCALEDAGWEVRDCLMWLYGSGFPKSLDVSKALDRGAGHWRGRAGARVRVDQVAKGDEYERTEKGDPVTEAARTWAGWGTALKPAWEPIVLARKPLTGTVAENVVEHGVGALNIDGCRVEAEKETGWGGGGSHLHDGGLSPVGGEARPVSGRWPANVVLDEDAAELLDEQSGEQKDGEAVRENLDDTKPGNVFGQFGRSPLPNMGYGGRGGASRFFYTAKASSGERHYAGKNKHPTVKPVALMQWLCRLVTPRGGLILDPFCGSGSTGVAAAAEGFGFIGIEQDPESVRTAELRIFGPLFA